MSEVDAPDAPAPIPEVAEDSALASGAGNILPADGATIEGGDSAAAANADPPVSVIGAAPAVEEATDAEDKSEPDCEVEQKTEAKPEQHIDAGQETASGEIGKEIETGSPHIVGSEEPSAPSDNSAAEQDGHVQETEAQVEQDDTSPVAQTGLSETVPDPASVDDAGPQDGPPVDSENADEMTAPVAVPQPADESTTASNAMAAQDTAGEQEQVATGGVDEVAPGAEDPVPALENADAADPAAAEEAATVALAGAEEAPTTESDAAVAADMTMNETITTDDASSGEQSASVEASSATDIVPADEAAPAVEDGSTEQGSPTQPGDGADGIGKDQAQGSQAPEQLPVDDSADEPGITESTADNGAAAGADKPELPAPDAAAEQELMGQGSPEAADVVQPNKEADVPADSAPESPAPDAAPEQEVMSEGSPEAADVVQPGTEADVPADLATDSPAPDAVDEVLPTQADDGTDTLAHAADRTMEEHANLDVVSECVEGDSAASSPIAAFHSSDSPSTKQERPFAKTETMRGRERVRKYLEDSVVPALRKGMRELVRTKPDDPFQFLADYLIKNKPPIEGN